MKLFFDLRVVVTSEITEEPQWPRLSEAQIPGIRGSIP